MKHIIISFVSKSSEALTYTHCARAPWFNLHSIVLKPLPKKSYENILFKRRKRRLKYGWMSANRCIHTTTLTHAHTQRMQYAEDGTKRRRERCDTKLLAAFFGFSSQSSIHIITSTLETFYHKSKMQVIRASVRSSVTVCAVCCCRTQNVDCTAHYMCAGNWLASLACLAIFKFNTQKIDSIRLELATHVAGDRNAEVYLLNSGCKRYEMSCRFVL